MTKNTKTQAKALNSQHTTMHVVTLTLITFFVLLLFSSAAHAGTNSAMGDALCSVVKIVYGNLGRGLATLAVVIIGVGATLGKTSWGLAITVAVGIAVIFNADVIVGQLGVNRAAGCY